MTTVNPDDPTPLVAVRHVASVFLPALLAISFVVHFIWEYVQCEAFFVHTRGPATMGAMLLATLGDLVLTLVAWLGTAIIAWNRNWPLQRWTPRV